MAITYQETKRVQKLWGIELTCQFFDGAKYLRNKTFRFDDNDQIIAELDSRIAQAINKIEVKKSRLNDFDIGEDSVDILRKGIIAIRATPTVTKVQAVTWLESNFPDTIFKGDVFFTKAQEFLRKELGFVPTWDQFKTYVINNKFIWMD